MLHALKCSKSKQLTIANSSQPLATIDFDRSMLLPEMFQETTQVREIDPSLLLVCGTICLFISMTMNYHFSS